MNTFPNPSKVNFKQISELLNNNAVKQSDFQLFLREVIKQQFNMAKGAIPVGDKTRPLSSCTAKELADFIQISFIKKLGT